MIMHAHPIGWQTAQLKLVVRVLHPSSIKGSFQCALSNMHGIESTVNDE